MVTSCLSEIMRILAPWEPYDDNTMKEVIQLYMKERTKQKHWILVWIHLVMTSNPMPSLLILVEQMIILSSLFFFSDEGLGEVKVMMSTNQLLMIPYLILLITWVAFGFTSKPSLWKGMLMMISVLMSWRVTYSERHHSWGAQWTHFFWNKQSDLRHLGSGCVGT